MTPGVRRQSSPRPDPGSIAGLWRTTTLVVPKMMLSPTESGAPRFDRCRTFNVSLADEPALVRPRSSVPFALPRSSTSRPSLTRRIAWLRETDGSSMRRALCSPRPIVTAPAREREGLDLLAREDDQLVARSAGIPAEYTSARGDRRQVVVCTACSDDQRAEASAHHRRAVPPDRLIAKGGMGAVYEVEHAHTGEHLALKLLLSSVGS